MIIKISQRLSTLITTIFKGSFESYGAPKIQVVLEELGYSTSQPRTARIMRVNGLFSRRKRKFKVTTNGNHKYPIADNILNQNFEVSRKNQDWVSSITYIETKQG